MKLFKPDTSPETPAKKKLLNIRNASYLLVFLAGGFLGYEAHRSLTFTLFLVRFGLVAAVLYGSVWTWRRGSRLLRRWQSPAVLTEASTEENSNG